MAAACPPDALPLQLSSVLAIWRQALIPCIVNVRTRKHYDMKYNSLSMNERLPDFPLGIVVGYEVDWLDMEDIRCSDPVFDVMSYFQNGK